MVAVTAERGGDEIPPIEPEIDEFKLAFQLLGGRKTMKRSVDTVLDAHDMIMRGFDTKSLFHLIESVTVLATEDALKGVLGISQRTLQRKRKEDGTTQRLSPEQSSRAWRFAEILAHATTALGSQAEAEQWMLEPAMGLDNRRPIDLLSTAAGVEAVEDHLTRIEYGVYI